MTKTAILKLTHRLECWRNGECAKIQAELKSTVGSPVDCVDGYAGEYPCENVRLLAHLDFNDLGCINVAAGFPASEGNDIWGWTSANPERHWALVGCTTGTSFVDITDPVNPKSYGWLPTPTVASTWRDIKVYKDHAFIVSEARGSGMQVFDLKRLLSASPDSTRVWNADAWYNTNMGSSNQQSTHNIAINEYTGRAYLVGCKTCSGGLLIVDITNPKNPQYAGCYSGDGYTHDAQCVWYADPNYPDRLWMNKEICFAFNEDNFTIVECTDPAKCRMISSRPYQGYAYCHQGWATPDMYYLFSDDELDEFYGSYDGTQRTVTYVWDISNLNEPLQTKAFQSTVDSIDHNQYIYGKCSYQANYASGLRVLRINGDLGVPSELPQQIAYFDVDPDPSHGAQFYGAWSVYADYPGTGKNTVVVDSIERGLFVLEVDKAALGCE